MKALLVVGWVFFATLTVAGKPFAGKPSYTCLEVAEPEITEQEAIEIARKKGYYETAKPWRQPEVKLQNGEWVIYCYKAHTTRRGKCRKTNGCSVVTTKTIRIDALSGAVINKKRTHKKYENYE